MSADVGTHLPTTLAFEYPTLEALRGYLAEELLGEPAGVGAPAAPARRAVDDPGALDDISDDEVVDKLLEELEDSGY
jgi:hypothetical protein